MDLCKLVFKSLSSLGLILFLGTTACQKSNNSSAEVAASSVDILSCPSGQYKSSSEQMSIQSSEVSTGIDTNVQFSLNTDALCSGAQKVQWSVPGATKLVSKGGVATASYSSPGEYVVAAKLTGGDQGSQELMTKALVVGEQIQFTGPQITKIFLDNSFSLVPPNGVSLVSVDWDFGDGNTASSSQSSIVHAYRVTGTFLVRVNAVDSNGVTTSIEHYVSVIVDNDELFCAAQVAVSSPSETHVGDSNTFAVFLPACVRTYLNRVSWDFGDTTSLQGESVNKIYDTVGLYTVRATIYLNSTQLPSISITRRIQVNDAVVQNKCPTEGQTRITYSPHFDEEENCGVNGKKTVTYRNRQNEICQRVDNILDWVAGTTEKELVSEGQCRGQACPLPGAPPAGAEGVIVINGQPHLIDGASITLYTSSNPLNTCEENKVVRSCSNGVLSGTTSNLQYQCTSGCGDFGPNGTVKIGIQVGTRLVPVTCQFGEQGIFDNFNEIEDRSCNAGSVNSSNRRLGDIISRGMCPTYAWHATDQYTTCSADCGGIQSMIYECRNNSGEKVDSSRCAGQIQIEKTRLCDANPEAVRRVDVMSENEQVTSTNKCPKNQIGVVLQNRDKITKKTYACINHKVDIEDTVVEYTPWIEERYCRDYVAHRCSGDSLSTTQARGRFDWMVKCAPEVPMLKEFLENFDDVKVGNNAIDSNRILYPTFMNNSTRPEKKWLAPTLKTASCSIPEGVYIAAVCVASCAIPQDKIVVQTGAGAKLGAVEFINALVNNYERVGTMTKNSSMSDRKLKASKVEQWVTELVDVEQPVLVFTMESGKTLSVTPNHPLLKKDGSMDTAEKFKAGDSLVALGGELDPIQSIESIIYFGKVYNVFVKSSVPQENIVVTNGYLNGSAYFQNEGAGNLNKTLLRKKLTKGVFGK